MLRNHHVNLFRPLLRIYSCRLSQSCRLFWKWVLDLLLSLLFLDCNSAVGPIPLCRQSALSVPLLFAGPSSALFLPFVSFHQASSPLQRKAMYFYADFSLSEGQYKYVS